ncbi:MAG: hypothetical protein HZB11_00730 [Candidatus Yonathbacteria bacterium]|nr:hypothetical protein [Candidatus Yonathbacteria bacterium]
MKSNITTKLLNAIKFSALALILSFGLSYALTWAAPTANPPAGNLFPPITTSSVVQTKPGAFTIGTTTAPSSLTVVGAIVGTGDICTSATGVAKCLSNLTDPSGLLIRALHTFKDCTTGGGAVYQIDEAKNICRFASILSGWTQYPTNWSTTQNVYCEDTLDTTKGGWENPPTRYPCNTGSHTFSDTPTESCTAYSYGKTCWYSIGIKRCAWVSTYTTCYATVTERGAY